jgi:hypothetical protein
MEKIKVEIMQIIEMSKAFNIFDEIYLPIKGYPNYSVSNIGNVQNIRSKRILKCAISTRGYKYVDLCNKGNNKKMKIHRLVADAFIQNKNNKNCVDHINHDITDNNAENLRWATNKENSQNKLKYKSNSSGFIGVSLQKSTKKWVARIKINGKYNYIGSFETAEEASQAYQEQAKLHFGEFHNSK